MWAYKSLINGLAHFCLSPSIFVLCEGVHCLYMHIVSVHEHCIIDILGVKVI